MEQTLVVIKPDGVMRGLAGEIIQRFEKVGLKLVASKMLKVSRELADKHYPLERREFIEGMGNKTLENYKSLGIDPVKELGTADAYEIGKVIREWLADAIMEGPVVAMVWEGPHAVELVRKLTGSTLPLLAVPGTIRGDFSFDSSYLANTNKRPIKNMIHASGNVEEARFEVPLWFQSSEIYSYKRVEEDVMK
ncbi:MAG: nucleoside-diphosphate kinase [Armatimonadetes bacterium]|nr:MAG: nucleoside-diphosphate kinase [Armatimonadota bacterium]